MLEGCLELLIIFDETSGFLRDMYYTEVAELRQERFVITMEHQEGVFLHLRNHALPPFSSAARASASRLDLTIFWLDLERFSSSSMNRLILRIAS